MQVDLAHAGRKNAVAWNTRMPITMVDSGEIWTSFAHGRHPCEFHRHRNKKAKTLLLRHRYRDSASCRSQASCSTRALQ
jgi:hypothetical protein